MKPLSCPYRFQCLCKLLWRKHPASYATGVFCLIGILDNNGKCARFIYRLSGRIARGQHQIEAIVTWFLIEVMTSTHHRMEGDFNDLIVSDFHQFDVCDWLDGRSELDF